jgi:hypothetical protein
MSQKEYFCGTFDPYFAEFAGEEEPLLIVPLLLPLTILVLVLSFDNQTEFHG